MSLENSIDKLTEAVTSLTAVLQNAAPAEAAKPAEKAPAKEEAPKKTATKAAKAEKPTVAKKEEPKEEKSDTNAVPYSEVRRVVLELGDLVDGEASLKILKEFGVGHAKELEESDYAACVEKFEAAIAKAKSSAELA